MIETVSGELLPPVFYASEDGQPRLVTADKNGEVHGAQESEGSRGFMPAICGSVVGAEIAAAFTLDDDAQELRWNSLREDSPWEVVGWALKAHDAVEPIRAILGPDDERRTVFEARMYPPDSAAEAVIQVAALLEMEQNVPETDRVVADTLRRNLLIGNPGEVVGPPADYMKRLLRGAAPENILEDLVYDMRTHHTAGDLIMAQKARADFINLKIEQGDTPEHFYAHQVADMFSVVIRSNKSCDPDALNRIVQSYVDEHGEVQYMRGPEIVHEAAKLMLNGKLKMQLGEIKSMTLIGEQYEGFDRAYRRSGRSLQNLFDKESLQAPANRRLRRELYYSYEYDIAKTSLAVWNMFRIAENEYHTQPHTFRNGQGELIPDSTTRRPDGLPEDFIDPTLVLREVEKVVVPIKFDIRANGRKVPRMDFTVGDGGRVEPKAADPKIDPLPEYAPVPNLSKLGIPTDVDVAHWTVDNARVEQLWKLWAWELAEPEAAKDRQKLQSKVVSAVRRSKGLATVSQ